jgi:hypothetical protein
VCLFVYLVVVGWFLLSFLFLFLFWFCFVFVLCYCFCFICFVLFLFCFCFVFCFVVISVRSLQCLVPNFTLLFSTSLLNVNFVQTNKPKFCQNVSNFNCGLSDYHNMISFQLKGYVPKIKKELI